MSTVSSELRPASPMALKPRLLSMSGGVPDSQDARLIVRLVRPLGIGHAVTEFSRDCLIRLIDFPEMPLRVGTREAIKTGRSALVVRADLPVGGRMTSVAYKRVLRRTWLKRLTSIPRSNRTLRAWQMAHVFRERQINTAAPLAVIVPRRHEIWRPSYLATEWIADAENLHAYYRRLESLDAVTRGRRLKRAAISLGQLLGRMHAQNISHRDLKPGNLLLVDDERATRSYIVDLDGARVERRLSQRLRMRNLARLLVGIDALPEIGAVVRLRFLKAYLAELENTSSLTRSRAWKNVWRLLIDATSILRWRKAGRGVHAARIPE